MDIPATLRDKRLKAKGKVEVIARELIARTLPVGELIEVAGTRNHKDKGTCIEAIEFATKVKPELGSVACLRFVIETLLDEAPRVKWESAKVVANIAHRHPEHLTDAIEHLLANSRHSGTVVRWSVARALGEIVRLRTKHNRTLIPAIETLLKEGSEGGTIKRIHEAALKAARQ